MVITTKQFNDGTSIDINVANNGEFFAEFNDNRYAAQSLAALVDLLEKAIKVASKLTAVDVTVLDLCVRTKRAGNWGDDDGAFQTGRGAVQARLRAKHAREYNKWLLVSDAGQKFHVSGHRQSRICRRMTTAEIEEYLRLATAADEATEALRAYIDGVALDPDEALGLKK